MSARPKKTVLAVVAHADDLEFMAGGTVARLALEYGYDVYQYILTDNGKGSYRLPREELVQVSKAEAQRAGQVLGLRAVRFEGYEDGELEQENPAVLRGKVMAMLREVRADIVMGWDPYAPYEDHPDHRAVARATLDAASFCGNPMFHPDHADPPYAVTEAYWFAKHPWNAELYVDIALWLETKIEALLCHACQMDLTLDMIRQEMQQIGVAPEALAAVGEELGHEPIAEGIRAVTAQCGAARGLRHAEQFRYQSLCMTDLFMGTQLVQCDFPAGG